MKIVHAPFASSKSINHDHRASEESNYIGKDEENDVGSSNKITSDWIVRLGETTLDKLRLSDSSLDDMRFKETRLFELGETTLEVVAQGR